MNDSIEEMTAIRDFLSAGFPPERVDLLPYHRMGENKYGALGKAVSFFSVPTPEQMAQFRAIFT